MTIRLDLYKAKNLFDVSEVEKINIRYHINLTYGDLLSETGWSPNDVLVVGDHKVIIDLSSKVLPGTEIVMVPNIHSKDAFAIAGLVVLAAASWGIGAAAMGFAAGISGVTAGVATGVGVAVGVSYFALGAYMVVGAMSGGTNPNAKNEEQSPTYSWDIPRNTADEGRAIPVCYGEALFAPQIINRWIEIIDNNGDHEEWLHTLLCCGEGKTNLPATKDEIYINEEKITIYQDDEYEVKSTDGDNFPDETVFDKFQKLHQMRSINKELHGKVDAETLASYLNFDYNFKDDGYQNIVWDRLGDPKIVSPGWNGTPGCVKLTGGPKALYDEDQKSNFHKMCIKGSTIWDIEVRAYLDSNHPELPKTFFGWDHYDAYWAGGKSGYQVDVWTHFLFYYDGSKLRFKSFKDDSDLGHLDFWNIEANISLSTNTWHTIRVARQGTIIYIFVDGVLLASSSYINSPPDSYNNRGRSYIGFAMNSTYPCNMRLDEWRMSWGKLQYPLSNYTPDDDEIIVTVPEVFITKGVVDEFTCYFNFPAGLYKVESDGKLDSKSVTIEIKYRKYDSGDEWTKISEKITDTSRSATKRAITIDNLDRDRYEIGCSRITPEDDETTESSRVFWDGVDEILGEFLIYPNLQCVSVSLKASEFIARSTPLIQVLVKRTSIEVPNYWDTGTVFVDPRNNAFAAFDMFTSKLYGVGIDPNRIDNILWEEWKDWCDGLVDGEKRCLFNSIFDAQYDFDKALHIVESCGRAKIRMRGTDIVCTIEKPTLPSYTYSSGNVMSGSEKVAYLRRAEIADGTEIRFRDKDRNYEFNTVFEPGENYHYLTRVPNIIKMSLSGINNLDQAKRESIFRQQLNDSIKRKVTFEVGINGIQSLTGDVIVYKEGGKALSYSGRLFADSSNSDQVYIDQYVNLDSAKSYKIGILLYNDTEIWEEITGPFDTDTNVLTLANPISASKMDVFLVIVSSEEKEHLYRIVSLKRKGTSQFITVEATEYSEKAYYNYGYASGNVPI